MSAANHSHQFLFHAVINPWLVNAASFTLVFTCESPFSQMERVLFRKVFKGNMYFKIFVAWNY